MPLATPPTLTLGATRTSPSNASIDHLRGRDGLGAAGAAGGSSGALSEAWLSAGAAASGPGPGEPSAGSAVPPAPPSGDEQPASVTRAARRRTGKGIGRRGTTAPDASPRYLSGLAEALERP